MLSTLAIFLLKERIFFSNKRFTFFSEPEIGMPEHQAHYYFRQLISAVVRYYSFYLEIDTYKFDYTVFDI